MARAVTVFGEAPLSLKNYREQKGIFSKLVLKSKIN